MRHWIMAVTMNAKGDLVSIEQFMPNAKFSAPIEMEFGPSGDLYVLEYGTAWFHGNDDARLVRIEYNAGNRKPIVAAAVDQPAGALPMRVKLSSAGTLDLDEDSLRYAWTISRRGGAVLQTLTEPNPSFTFTRAGSYTASLTVTDTHGAKSSAAVSIVAGNEPPDVNLDLVGVNKSFYFPGVPVRYAARVTDREDGSLQSGTIPARRVAVTAQYLKEGLPSERCEEPARDRAETGRRQRLPLLPQVEQEIHRSRVPGCRAEVSRRQHGYRASRPEDPRRGIRRVGQGDDGRAPPAHRRAGCSNGRLHPEPRRPEDERAITPRSRRVCPTNWIG